MTAHRVVHRTIPQMRTHPGIGVGAVTVRVTVSDGVTTLAVRGAAVPAALEPLLTALDAVFEGQVRGVILDGTGVTDWSRRSLEVGVHTATRARSRRIGFALCGLPDNQLEVLRQQWPGVRSEQFAFPDVATARAALLR